MDIDQSPLKRVMFNKYSKRLSALFLCSQVLLGPQCPLFSDPPPSTIFVTTNSLNNTTPNSLSDYDGSLDAAILWAVDGTTIDCSAIAGQTIQINTFRLPAIGSGLTSPRSSITILGSGVTIDGGNSFTGFSLAYGSATITDFTIQNTTSQGGAGGSGYTGGGGGTGGGGAIYVHSGTTLTISAVSMNGNQAIGGDGGAGTVTNGGSGGGGGGYGGGAGGFANLTGPAAGNAGSGGGGGGNAGGTRGGRNGGVGSPNTFSNFGGAGGGGEVPRHGSTNGAASGGTTAASCYTTSHSGGAGGTGTVSNGAGAGSGGGAGASGSPGANATPSGTGIGGAPGLGLGIYNDYGAGGAGAGGNGGGAGLGGSGGGGGLNGPGGAGGLLGGGGGGSGTGTGGVGGFGAGGGAGSTGGGSSLYGLGGSGGAGSPAGGGGGSGLGGAIFIQKEALLIVQDGVSFSGNSTTAGLGGAVSGTPGGNGSSLGQDIFIRSGGSITFQVDGSLSIPSPIEGGGSFSDVTGPGLIMSGLGTVQLNGTNTYMGNTLIQSGTLNLNGSINGNLQIESSGTLSGNATIGDRIYNSGNISPGNSIGQVLTTDLYLEPTSIYNVEVNSLGNSDQIIASGIVELNGGIVVSSESGSFTAPLTYTILSAGSGITGTFSSLTSTVPSLMNLLYSDSSIELVYLPIQVTGISGDALNAARCFSSLNTIPSSDVAYVNNTLLNLSFESIEEAFTQMGPAQFSTLTEVQLLNAILVRSTYTRHMEEYCHKKDPSSGGYLRFWIDGVAQWQDQKKSGRQIGYTDTTGGGSIGLDYCMNEFVLGIALSSTYDHLEVKNFGSKGNINSYYAGFYGKWSDVGFFLNTALIGAFNKYRNTRTLNFAQVVRDAHSTHNGNEWLGNLGLGYQVCLHHFSCTPYINLDYVWQHENSYAESGAGSLDLQINSKNSMLVEGELGLTLSTSCKAGSGMFVPTITLAYLNQTPLSSKNYKASFKGSTCTFTGKGGNYERNLFAPGLCLSYLGRCQKVNASIYYDGEIGSSYWAQDVGFELSFRF